MGPRWLTALALGAVLTLTACSASGDGSEPGADGTTGAGTTSGSASGKASGTASPGPAPYLPVPKGVVLTDPGSELEVGETGTVAWRPRKREVGVLNLKVRQLVHADIKALADWQLDPARRGSSLFYVHVTVANVGDTDLGGIRVPLLVLDGSGALVESSAFRTEFKPCPSQPLPKGFVTGDKVTVCLAYLVPRHGTLQAAAFRPTESFNPITWVGQVTRAEPPKKKPDAG